MFENEIPAYLQGLRKRFPPHPQSTGRMACQLHAEAQEAHCAATEAQGRVPPLPIAASGSGRAVDQPDAAEWPIGAEALWFRLSQFQVSGSLEHGSANRDWHPNVSECILL